MLTKSVRNAAIAAGLSLGLAANGAALAGDKTPTTLIDNFNIETLQPVLNDLGVTTTAKVQDNGTRFLQAVIGSNFAFNVVPTACVDDSCAGVLFVALYQGAKLNYQTITAFNQKYAFTTAGLLPGDDVAYLARYEIADFGIPQGNIQSSLESFATIADEFDNQFASMKTTVSQEGYASDMSARLLNSKVAKGMGIQPASHTDAAKLVHLDAFERTSEIIMMLNAAQSTPKNKILNSGK